MWGSPQSCKTPDQIRFWTQLLLLEHGWAFVQWKLVPEWPLGLPMEQDHHQSLEVFCGLSQHLVLHDKHQRSTMELCKPFKFFLPTYMFMPSTARSHSNVLMHGQGQAQCRKWTRGRRQWGQKLGRNYITLILKQESPLDQNANSAYTSHGTQC